jgi:hypothetical protein
MDIIIIIIIIMTSADLAQGTEQKGKPSTDPADDQTVMMIRSSLS